MSNLFTNWFSVNGFRTWKLVTPMDYFFFGVLVVGGLLLLWLATRFLAGKRTPEKAIARSARKLKKLGGKGAACYERIHLNAGEDSLDADLILAAEDGVYIAKVYHWGYHVNGAMSDEKWIFDCGPRDAKKLPNPMPQLNQSCSAMRRILTQEKAGKVPVKPLVIFAENYTNTVFRLKNVSCAWSYRDLKKWRELHPIEANSKVDVAAVKAAIEKYLK